MDQQAPLVEGPSVQAPRPWIYCCGTPMAAMAMVLVVISGAPLFLHWLGLDLATRSVPFNPMFLAGLSETVVLEAGFSGLKGAFQHAYLEAAAIAIAYFTAALCFLHFALKRQPITPIIGVGFLCAGTVDLFHALSASRLITAVTPNEVFVPFTWAVARVFGAIIITVGAAILLTPRLKGPRPDLKVVFGIGVFFMLTALVVMRLLAHSTSLPQTMYPEGIITRPWDVAPLLLYVFAGLVVFPRLYRLYPTVFAGSLLLATIPQVATEAYMAVGSTALYDHYFNSAHALKLLSYALPLGGLLVDYAQTYRREQNAVRELGTTQRELEVANASLVEQTAMLDLTIENVREGIIVANLDAEYTMVNGRAERIIGMDIESRDPSTWPEHYGVYDPATGELVDHQDIPLMSALRGEERDMELLVRNEGKPDGVLLSISGRPIRGPDGTLAGGLVSFNDITEEWRAREEIKRQAEALARSNADLQQFASVASHDLQEPLRKVMAFADMLSEHAGERLDVESHEYITRITSAVERLQRLIKDLLQYSRVSTAAVAFEHFDGDEVLDRAIDDLHVRINETRGRIERDQLPQMYGAPLQVQRLLQNLIGNALKYHRPGTPPIVQVRSESVPSGRADEHPGYRISVIDNGIGFDPKYSDRIFQVFKRLHGRTEYEGTGIGLAVCAKIAERHGWALDATGETGKGATFTITIPPSQSTVREPEDHRFRRRTQSEARVVNTQ